MYRILKASKDSYVTNKIILARSQNTSSTDANVGQAGTIDIYKLYNETPVSSGSSGIELTRGLIQFNLEELQSLTSSFLNISDPSFKCYLSMKNVYGGQTVPSNYTLSVYPLAKDWNEGRGNDVIGYRDLDAVNWYTASLNPTLITWTSGGIGYGSDSSDTDADYYTLLSSSTGYLPLEFKQSFTRGDEDLFVDVTTAISAAVSGELPNYGLRLSFTGSQETDSITRFVKRLSTKQSRNTDLHPALVVKYDDTFIDNQAASYFDYPNKIGVYFNQFGNAANFISGSSIVSGSGSLILELKASQSVYVTTSSFSISHNAVITYTSASWNYFSQSFTGSQVQIGGLNQTGSYYADVYLPLTAQGLSGVLNSSNEATFTPTWKSLDNTVIFSHGQPIKFSPQNGSNVVIPQRNYAVNITNLKNSYINTDVVRLRVFAYNFDTTLNSFYIPYKPTPKIFTDAYWRLVDPYSKEIIIPFDIDDKGTKLSVDGEGMYFDLYMQDLTINKPLEIELMIKEFGGTYLIQDQQFIFKVVKS